MEQASSATTATPFGRAESAGGSAARSGAWRDRLEIIDRLRGLVIALMVLDHVREFLHVQALTFDPTDPSRTNAALFATRWVTHLCAPTFVFLAGASVRLQKERGRGGAGLDRYLVSRGLWLVALELTIVSFGFNLGRPFLFLQVIWAIGLGMILLTPVTRAPPLIAVGIGAAILLVAGPVAVRPPALPWAILPWRLLVAPGPLPYGWPGLVAYPVLPWFGVLCIGYGLGGIWLMPAGRLHPWLVFGGLTSLLAFVALRLANHLGDPRPWVVQTTADRSALSFLNVTKYPPSLDYVLATLGCSLAAAPALMRLPARLADVLLAYGRTPLFTYLLHVYLAHGLAVACGVGGGLPARLFTNFLSDPGGLKAAGWGFGLAWVYAATFGVLAALYPVSRWFAGVKARHRLWWIAYL